MTRTVELTQRRAAPALYTSDDFIDDDEIAALLAYAARHQLARDGRGVKADETGLSFELPIVGDALAEELRDRIAMASGLDNDFGATFRFRRYRAGEQHPPHRDCYPLAGRALVATALVYLEAPASGGETRFAHAVPEPLQVTPKRGRLVLWFNHLPDGSEDPAAEHESIAIGGGEKTTLTFFIYKPVSEATARPEPRTLTLGARPGSGLRFHCVGGDDVPDETTRLLKSACARRGVEYVNVSADDFDFATARPLGRGDLMYRPAVALPAIRVEQALWSPEAATLHTSKHGVYYDAVTPPLILERAGVTIPRTIYGVTNERARLRRYVEHLGGLPVIVKWLGRSSGIGVVRADSWPALFSLVDHAVATGGNPLMSQFIPDATHFRLVVVDGKVVSSYRNAQAKDDFRSYGSEDADDYLVPLDPAMAELAIAATRALGLEMAGVDVLRGGDGKLYVLEANFPCFFPQGQYIVGTDVSGIILDCLIRKARS